MTVNLICAFTGQTFPNLLHIVFHNQFIKSKSLGSKIINIYKHNEKCIGNHCVKYKRIRVFFDPNFLIQDHRENTDQRKAVFWNILRSELYCRQNREKGFSAISTFSLSLTLNSVTFMKWILTNRGSSFDWE